MDKDLLENYPANSVNDDGFGSDRHISLRPRGQSIDLSQGK